MKDKLLIIFLVVGFFQISIAQQRKIDSLQIILSSINDDTAKILTLNKLSLHYGDIDINKSFKYADMANSIAINENYHTHDADIFSALASSYWGLGDYDQSLNYYLKKLNIVEQKKDSVEIIETYRYIVSIFIDMKKHEPALDYLHKILDISIKNNYKVNEAGAYDYLGIIYLKQNNTIKAQTYWEKALEIYIKKDIPSSISYTCSYLGKLFQRTGEYDKALNHHLKSLSISKEQSDKWGMSVTMNYIGNIYFEKGLNNKARQYYIQSLDTAKKYSLIRVELLSYKNLVTLYKAENNYKNAFDYYEQYITLKNKIYTQEKDNVFTELQIKHETEKKEKENEILRKSERIKNLIILIISILSLILLVFAVFIWNSMRIKNRNNKILEDKNREITLKNTQISEQKEELQTLADDLFVHKEDLERIVDIRTAELQKAKAQAVESDKLKTEFFNNLSHEIRTPLNAIVGFANILIDSGITTEERVEFHKIIQQSSDQLLEKIHDILEISELNTNQAKLFKQPVNLDQLFTRIKTEFQPKALKKSINININIKLLNQENILDTDECRLKKIMTKLIENALKFSDTGSIEVSYKKLKNAFEFCIIDNGIGIDRNMKEKIFKSFSQENIEISRDFGGLGIGLAIAKENVKLLGGKINFKSEKGKGTTFFFTIPFK